MVDPHADHATWRGDVQGRVPMAEGVEAFLFDRNGQGILVLWDRGRADGVQTAGAEPRRTGRSASICGGMSRRCCAGGAGRTTRCILSSGRCRRFLVDIDGAQAQLRASVRLISR